jgi:hypothetical protein
MSDQQVKYTITADASQANNELAKVDKAAASLVGNEKALATETAKATKAIADQGKVATTTAASTETMRQRIGKSAENLSKQAAAVSLVSSSMEGMGGNIGKMVAGAGQMAAAYGAGGPFALALVGGIALIDAVSKAAMRSIDETDAAFNKFYANMDRAAVAVNEQRDRLAAAIKAGTPAEVLAAQDVRERKAAAEAEIAAIKKSMAVSSTEEERKINAVAIRNREKTIELIDKETQKLKSNKNAQDSIAFRAQFLADAEKKKTEAIESGTKALERRLKISDAMASGLSELARVGDNIETSTDELSRTMRGMRGVEGGGLGGAMRAGAADDNDILTVTDKQAKLIQLERDFQGTLREIRDEERKKEEDSYKEFYSSFGALAKQGANIAISASQDYIQAKIEGDKHAEEMFASSIMGQAGQALISTGVQLGGQAIQSALTPGLQPLAALQGAAAVGLIGSGMALGGAAAGINQSIAGKELPDKKAAKDKGASPGRNSGSGGGGPLVVNVAYGAGGPLPEDTAREIQKAVDTGRRRGGR